MACCRNGTYLKKYDNYIVCYVYLVLEQEVKVHSVLDFAMTGIERKNLSNLLTEVEMCALSAQTTLPLATKQCTHDLVQT